MVVAVTFGLKVVPVFTTIPPVKASHQLMVPLPAAARFTTPPGSQISSWVTLVIDGVDATVIVKVIGVPVQEPFTGVTVIVPDIGAAVALVARKEGISPEPLAPKPIAVFVFVQLKVVPGTEPVKLITGVDVPAQKY